MNHRRHVLFMFAGALTVLTLLHFLCPFGASVKQTVPWIGVLLKETVPFPPVMLCDGERKSTFRESLRPDYQYVTSVLDRDWNHQVTTLFDVLHGVVLAQGELTGVDLGVLIPPFTPKLSHLGTKFAPSLPFSDVFDLPRLVQKIEIPVVEWHQVKQPTACCGNITMAPQEMLSEFAQQVEEELLSCWAAPMSKAKSLRRMSSDIFSSFGLKPQYAPLPSSMLDATSETFSSVVYNRLTAFLLPFTGHLSPIGGRNPQSQYETAHSTMTGSDRDMKVLTAISQSGGKPQFKDDVDILCFDWVTYGADRLEHGAWLSVGRHSHWNTRVLQIAKEAILLRMDMPLGSKLPNFIAVHIRRNEFVDGCRWGPGTCLEVPAYKEHVERVREELKTKGHDNMPVVVTTDETDAHFLNLIVAEGWYLIEHDRLGTVDAYGAWYPTVIDACILSLGTGVVGTRGSTMTTLAQLRAKAWNPVYVGALTGMED